MGTNQVGRRYSTRMGERGREAQRALVRVALDAMNEMLDRGRADIAAAGNFGPRWTQGYTGRLDQSRGDISITMRHAVPYWTTHQYGAHIEGRPLLWIPLSFNEAAQGVSARDYPHPLVRVDRQSGAAPLLLDTVTKEPAYSGHESVDVPKRFHLIEIIREVAKTIPQRFRSAVRR